MTDDDSAGEEEEDLLADIDHVTYVCREGESLKILAFYKVGTAFPEQSDIFQIQFFSMLSPAMASTGLWPLLKDIYYTFRHASNQIKITALSPVCLWQYFIETLRRLAVWRDSL